MRKGRRTRDEILNTAMRQASELGLEGLSIGALARQVGMSKSGLFAHFGSKEELQKAVLVQAAALFVDRVVRPAITEPRGEPRIHALYENWMAWTRSAPMTGGCIFTSTASEFDDRPGPVRDEVARQISALNGALARSASIAIEAGHFRDDLDPEQFAFELYAIFLSHQLHHRLFRRGDAEARARAAFESLLARSRV